MKRVFGVLLALFSFAQLVFPQSSLFTREFDEAFIGGPCVLVPQTDGDMLLGFNKYVGPGNTSSTVLVKLTEQGDTLWSRIYVNFSLEDAVETTDGFVLAGNGLIKVDTQGVVKWHVDYQIDRWRSISKDSGTGFIIAGWQALAHIDANGNLIWEKDIPYLVSAVIRTLDGNYAGAGFFANDIILTRFTEQGTHLGTWAFANNSNAGRTSCWDLVQTPDSSLYFCGSYWDAQGVQEPYLTKTNPNGELQWWLSGGWMGQNGASRSDQVDAYSLVASEDGAYLYMTGNTGSSMGGLGGRDPYVVKVDSSGTPLAIRGFLYGGTGREIARDTNGDIWITGDYHSPLPEKTFVSKFSTDLGTCDTGSGSSFTLNTFYKDSLINASFQGGVYGFPFNLTKFTKRTNIQSGLSNSLVCRTGPTSIHTLFNNLAIHISPNPTQGKIKLSLELGAGKKYELRLMGLDGRTILLKTQLTQDQYQLDVSSLADGIYILEVIDSDGIMGRKKFFKY